MLNKNKSCLLITVFIFGLVGLCMNMGQTSASILFNRNVILSSYLPSEVVTQTFKFDIPTTSVVGSIVFEYCSNSPSFYASCTAPTGLDVTGSSLASQSGNIGFNIDNADTSANRLV